MKIYVNEKGEIHDVDTNTLSDPTLTEVEVDDNSFDGMSKAMICCFKVKVTDGQIMSTTPYVDSRLIDHIDQLGKQVEAVTPTTMTKTAYTDDTYVTFYEVPTGNVTVYIGGYSGNYTVNRVQDRLTVEFEPLEEVTEVTISII